MLQGDLEFFGKEWLFALRRPNAIVTVGVAASTGARTVRRSHFVRWQIVKQCCDAFEDRGILQRAPIGDECAVVAFDNKSGHRIGGEAPLVVHGLMLVGNRVLLALE